MKRSPKKFELLHCLTFYSTMGMIWKVILLFISRTVFFLRNFLPIILKCNRSIDLQVFVTLLTPVFILLVPKSSHDTTTADVTWQDFFHGKPKFIIVLEGIVKIFKFLSTYDILLPTFQEPPRFHIPYNFNYLVHFSFSLHLWYPYYTKFSGKDKNYGLMFHI